MPEVVSGVGASLDAMKVKPPGMYDVRTRSSTYIIDTVAHRAVRSPRGVTDGSAAGVAAAEVPLHRRPFTDRAPLDLIEVPEPVIGERIRLRIRVAEEFLEPASRGKPADMLSTEVVEIRRLPLESTPGSWT